MELLGGNVMQTSSRNLKKKNGSANERTNFAGGKVLASRPRIIKLLLAILGSGVLAVAGPTISHTVTHLGLVSLQIVLQVGRLALATFQVFGD
jgi:hypothetical protein